MIRNVTRFPLGPFPGHPLCYEIKPICGQITTVITSLNSNGLVRKQVVVVNTHTHTRVCVCVCIYIYIYIYIYICVCVCVCVCVYIYIYICVCVCVYIYICVCVGSGGARGACAPHFFDWGGNGIIVPPPPPHTLLTPHFYFPLEFYVYITLTNNYLAFFIY